MGSLVRPPEVLEGILTKVAGQPRDEAAFNEQVRAGVVENLKMQAEVGIDVPSDGEVGTSSFSGYVTERLGGLKVVAEPPPVLSGEQAYLYDVAEGAALASNELWGRA